LIRTLVATEKSLLGTWEAEATLVINIDPQVVNPLGAHYFGAKLTIIVKYIIGGHIEVRPQFRIS